MGGTSSKSIVKNSTDQTIGSKLSVLQSTNTSNSCNQIVNIEDCVIDGDLTAEYNCTQSISMDATQAADLLSETENDLSQTIETEAEATGQNVSLNPGSTTADSIVDNTTKLNTDINASITQAISGSNTSDQKFNAKRCEVNGNTKILFQSVQDLATAVNQDALLTSSASQSLEQDLSASSKATTENGLTSALIALAILVAVFFIAPAIAAAYGVKAATSVFGAAGAFGMAFVILVALIIWFSISCGSKGTICYKSCMFAEEGAGLWSSKCCANGSDADKDTPRDSADNEKCGDPVIKPWWKIWSSGSSQGDLLDSTNCLWWKNSDKTKIQRGGCDSHYRTSVVITLIVMIIMAVISLVFMVLFMIKRYRKVDTPKVAPVSSMPKLSKMSKLSRK